MNRYAAVVLIVVAAGCNAADHTVAPLARLSGERLADAVVVVRAGGSIQAAVAAARPHTVIRIEPGIYTEAIQVTVPDLKLVGERGRGGEGVVIANPGGAEDGISVDSGSDGFELVNVSVRGFDGNGVQLTHVDGFLLSGVTAVDNAEYGLYPVHSSNGVIERCQASGSNDTGIYVGQSHDIIVRQSDTFDNVNGIEVENSQRVRVLENDTYDNVVGILVVLLPGLQVKTTSDVLVSGNRVHDNNHPNFAPQGDLASFVPTGSGILVVGADRTVVEENTVTGNQFTGIAVGSALVLGALSGLPPEAFADIEPNPDSDRIADNFVAGNGAVASPVPFLPAVDLLWDGSGTANCWHDNRFGTSVPAPLPACADHESSRSR